MKGQLTKTSSKINRPPPRRLTSTAPSRVSKTAPRNSNISDVPRGDKYIKPTLRSPSSTWKICPLRMFDPPDEVTSLKLSTVSEFFHIPKMRNASMHEAIFLHVLYAQLATQARMLAAILPWSVQRPCRALLAAMHGKRAKTTNCRCVKMLL